MASPAQELNAECGSVTVTHVSQDIPCATVGGLLIEPDLAGSLSLDGVREIISIDIDGNTGLEYLGSTSLTRVKSGIYLRNSTSLGRINFPNLTVINNFVVDGAPLLKTIVLGDSGVLVVDSVRISGTALMGLEFNPASVASLIITDNPSLQLFSSDVQSLAGGGSFDFDLDMKYSSLQLPDMVWANTLNIDHVSRVNLQSLVSINSSLELQNNTFDSLSLPVLGSVGQILSLVNNSNVVEVDFPLLEKVSNLTITGNPAIMELDGFPKLADVTNRVVLEGDFK